MLALLFVLILIGHLAGLAGMHQDALLWWWSTMQAMRQLGFALTTMFTLAYLLRWVQSHQFNICQSNELQQQCSWSLPLLAATSWSRLPFPPMIVGDNNLNDRRIHRSQGCSLVHRLWWRLCYISWQVEVRLVQDSERFFVVIFELLGKVILMGNGRWGQWFKGIFFAFVSEVNG